jgi:GNAT superfamily N-acetyltransferase
MIRSANKFDVPQIIEMLWNYHDSGTIKGLDVANDKSALNIVSMIVAGAGIALVSEKNNKLTGMLLAICVPYLWDNTKLVMNEVAYWVEPEHRGGTAGYRLLKQYTELCDDMKDQGRIQFYTISQMEGQSLNYERFGFRPIEHTWSI